MKVYGYVRVSTQKQGRGVSLNEQREAIRSYAARNALTVERWFEERETAAKSGRPIFGMMLRALKAGNARGVVMHKIDRSARNLRDWVDINELIDHGISIHFAHESVDLRSRGGRLSADIQAVIAADFIRNLREETRKGFYGRLKQGFYPLPAPVGYRNCGGGKHKQVDPVKGPLVKNAFELYATGRYSLETVAAKLAPLGLVRSGGKPLSRNGMSTLLNNPFYTGRIVLRSTGETFAGRHEPVVSAALFKRVQAVLSGKTVKRVGRHGFLYRRLLSCACCGLSLVGELQKGHVYYRCHTKGCPTTGLREESVSSTIESVLADIELSDSEVSEVLTRVPSLMRSWNAARDDRMQSLRLQEDAIASRRQRLTDAFLDGEIDKDSFERRKASLVDQELLIHEERVSNRVEIGAVEARFQSFLELAKSARLTYFRATPDEKREFLELVTSNRAVTRKELSVELHSPFRELANRPPVRKCDPYRDAPRTSRPAIETCELLWHHAVQMASTSQYGTKSC